MNAREQGFLLLTSHLGNPERKVLTTAQLRRLATRAKELVISDKDALLGEENLVRIGYRREEAQRILSLLNETDVLSWYLNRAAAKNCVPITRVSEQYPGCLRLRLGTDCPGCLWAKGNLAFLNMPAIALVGSRDLKENNLAFAKETGRQAALQGYVLVSGNARGADRAAQDACLENGGYVISVVADQLEAQPENANILYLSEDCYDGEFSTQRALSRNRVIHCLADRVFVAQSALGKGGTWDGATKNLRYGWSSVFCFCDGAVATNELCQRGAQTVDIEKLQSIRDLNPTSVNFL